jgi:hypothetical protein
MLDTPGDVEVVAGEHATMMSAANSEAPRVDTIFIPMGIAMRVPSEARASIRGLLGRVSSA